MSPEDLEYYRERARDERVRAAAAGSEAAAEIHVTLAALYEQLIELEDSHKRPNLSIVA